MPIQENKKAGDTDKALDLLRDAIESLTEGFALYDEDRCLVMCNTRYIDMNQGVADLLQPGLDWEILMRESARRGIYSEAIGKEENWVSDRLDNGIEFIQDYELSQTDGKTYLVSVHPTELGGFVVTKTDITEKKNAEVMQRDGDLLIRTVLDASSAVVTMVRVGDGQILYRSPAATQLFGMTNSSKEHFVNQSDRADFITELLVDGQVDEFKTQLYNARNEPFPAMFSARVIEYKGEEAIVSSISDLTERTKAEALIRQVLEASPAPIQMSNAETGTLLFTSLETNAQSGEAERYRAFFKDRSERPKFIAELRKTNWVKDYKTKFTDSRGETFWGAISARLIEFNGEEVLVSNTRDITDELAVQEELANQRELIFQNEKMSALGELLAGVAHELNNPLSVVVGHSLMLQEEMEDPEAIRRIEKISGAAERCAKIVKTFLAMARQQPAKMESMDINSVIETAVDVAGYGKKDENLKIKHTLGYDLPKLTIDQDQITQVIINLIMNAEQAITKSQVGDLIEVTTQESAKENAIEIFVKDNGPGIPDNVRARVFEPFFTTKEVGEGTGIGLAFCHRIILSHEGKIWLDPNYKEGSRFCIRLPATTENEEVGTKQKKVSNTKENVNVLVIDDEIDVGELTSEILRKDGFNVTLMNSGSEGLSALNEKPYDILLSDLNMPEIDGRGIYEIVSRDFPQMLTKMAFITGDIMGVNSRSLLKESRLPYLEKPISPVELRELVYDLLKNKKDEE